MTVKHIKESGLLDVISGMNETTLAHEIRWCDWCFDNEAIENVHGYDLCVFCIAEKVVIAV